MLAIIKKELKMYYSSLFTYIFYAVFFMVLGIFFTRHCLTDYSTQFGYYVLNKGILVLAAMVPLCTMKLFAMEKRSRTDQLLFTAPVSMGSVLLGKYIATVLFMLIPVICSCIYPIYIAMHGEMSVRFLMGSYIAGVLLILVLVALGIFVSTLTTNIVLAAVITYAVYVIVALERILESVVSSDGMYQFLHNGSVYNKFNDMASGIIRSGDVVYLLLLSIGLLVVTWLVLETRRNNWLKTLVCSASVVCLVALGSFVAFKFSKVYDFTAPSLLTFSEQTKEVVSQIDKQTTIYYMGQRSRANATYQELLNEYQKLNDNIEVKYVNIENEATLRQTYLANVSYINESSMLVVCDDRFIYLDSDNYQTVTQSSLYTYKAYLEIEQQLTSAIYYTNAETVDKLCVVSGHGEEMLNSNFENMLALNNYTLEELNLPAAANSLQDIFPTDCKAVFINAPQYDLEQEELDILADYLKQNGKLVVVLDPLNEELPQLYAFLKEYGLDVQSGVVIEQDESRYVYETPYYLSPNITDTLYTKEVINKNLTVLTMTSKGILTEGESNGYVCTDILTTSAKAFSKVGDFENITQKGDSDITGPFSVATCSENPDEGTLFLMTSNVFFNEQADTESNGSNRKFFLEIMKQMTDTESTIWVEAKEIGNQVALYPNEGRTVLKILCIAGLPFIIIIIGITVIILRSRNIQFNKLKKRDCDAKE